MNLSLHIVSSWLVLLAAAVTASHAQQKPQPAPDYPNKTVHLVTAEPGGGQDFIARLIAPGLAAFLGQPAIVENRGGSGTIAPDIVARAAPDGYYLLVAGSTFWVASLIRKTTYDPVKDFTPIAFTVNSPNILSLHPSVPAKSVRELIELAKAKPGVLNYAGAGIGSSSHLGAELFKSLAGVNIQHIPTKGSGPAALAVLGGDVQMTFATPASVNPHIKSGKLRAVAVTSPKPSALAPGLPTIADTLPGFEIGAASAMFAPAGTPAAIVNRLNREVVRVLSQAEIKEKFFIAGLETVGSSPEESAASLKSEIARLGKVVRDTGIRED